MKLDDLYPLLLLLNNIVDELPITIILAVEFNNIDPYIGLNDIELFDCNIIRHSLLGLEYRLQYVNADLMLHVLLLTLPLLQLLAFAM